MCIFITVIAKAWDKDLVSKILKQAGRRAELVNNPSLRKIIGEDEVQLLTTNGHCDCGTVLGDVPFDQDDDALLRTEIRKLKRKKWSDTKIERYIFDRQKTKIKKERSRQDQGGDTVELWSEIISTSLHSGAPPIGLFYRMYSGAIATEIFDAAKRTVKFRDFQDVEFKTLSENEIVYFT